MGSGNGLGHCQTQAGSRGSGGEKRLAQPTQCFGVDAFTAVAYANPHRFVAAIQVDLQTRRPDAGL